MKRQFAGRMLLEQIKHRSALAENVGAVAFGGGRIFTDIGQQSWLGHGAARVLRHDLDLLASRDRLDFIERLVLGAAAEIRFDSEFLCRQWRELGEPALEVALEIAAGVALAPPIHAARPESRHLLVDQPRNRLIGRGPATVAAAE